MNRTRASGVERYSVTNREVSGSCDPEVVALSAYNPWEDWEDATPGAISAQIGNATGNTCVISMPNVLKSAPKFGDREGFDTYALSFKANPTLSAGNNEVKITFK